jgi:hypothetical protein
LASDNAANQPSAAFADLQLLVRHLGDELTVFRNRALSAEARVRTLVDRVGHAGVDAGDRLAELEQENAELRQRLATAGEQAREMLARLRFLRQQQQQDGSEQR